MKLPTHKEELKQTNRLGMVSRKVTGRLRPVLLALNSDIAPNYKYRFNPHRGPLPRLWNITVKFIQSKTLWWNKVHCKGHDAAPKPKHKKITYRTTNFDNQAPTIWNRLRRAPSFSLKTTYHWAIKEAKLSTIIGLTAVGYKSQVRSDPPITFLPIINFIFVITSKLWLKCPVYQFYIIIHWLINIRQKIFLFSMLLDLIYKQFSVF